jgi:hypothetical protein
VAVGDFVARFNSSIPTICRPEAAVEQLLQLVQVDVFRSDMLRQAARPKYAPATDTRASTVQVCQSMFMSLSR